MNKEPDLLYPVTKEKEAGSGTDCEEKEARESTIPGPPKGAPPPRTPKKLPLHSPLSHSGPPTSLPGPPPVLPGPPPSAPLDRPAHAPDHHAPRSLGLRAPLFPTTSSFSKTKAFLNSLPPSKRSSLPAAPPVTMTRTTSGARGGRVVEPVSLRRNAQEERK